MIMIVKAIIVLLLDIAIYYIIGTAITEKFQNRINTNVVFHIVMGFIIYQIIFQVCAIPFIMLKRSLTELTIIWSALITVIIILALIKARKQISKDLCILKGILKKHKLLMGITIVVVLIVCWYTTINGELNDDSLYYIGVVNTTVTTDTMFQYNAYTGVAMPSHYFRRVLVTFEINAAVLCRIFGIHPIIIMRVFRGNLNVVLTALTIALIGTTIFRKEDTIEKSAILVCVSMALYFIADCTIYSNAAFFLSRTYEGKAYAGNALIYFMIYLCICLMQTENKQYLLLIGLLIWGCSAISSSAVMVSIAGAATMLLSCLIFKFVYMKTRKKRSEK